MASSRHSLLLGILILLGTQAPAFAVDAEEAAWLQRISANPGDDDLRLKFGDWLDAKRRPFQEARLIRVQIRLRDPKLGPDERTRLQAEEKSLTAFLNAGEPNVSLTFDRGLVTRAVLHEPIFGNSGLKPDLNAFAETTAGLQERYPLLGNVKVEYGNYLPSVELQPGLTRQDLRRRFIAAIRPIVHPPRDSYYDDLEEEEEERDRRRSSEDRTAGWLRLLNPFPAR